MIVWRLICRGMGALLLKVLVLLVRLRIRCLLLRLQLFSFWIDLE